MSWKSGLVDWTENKTAYISVVFSWQKQEAYQKSVWYRSLGYDVKVGGPGATEDIFGEMGNYEDAICFHNPEATLTSRGCIRKCPFCIVPQREGDLRELNDWQVRPIVCDNNLLACSKKHFDSVIDKLKPLKGVDINSGLDPRLLTKYHAERLRELNTRCVRLSWDFINQEEHFMRAFGVLTRVGFSTWHIRAYVLIGFNDTPEDALYRLQTIKNLKAWPSPMRYQPIDAARKNSFVGKNWNETLLKDYMRYWSRQNWLSKVPFSEYQTRYKA